MIPIPANSIRVSYIHQGTFVTTSIDTDIQSNANMTAEIDTNVLIIRVKSEKGEVQKTIAYWAPQKVEIT